MMRFSRRSQIRISALCLFTFSFCFPFAVLAEERGTLDAGNPAGAVVQLLAIGPGAGDKNAACAATGFLVNEDGTILTNAHVVEDARRCLAGSSEAKIVAKLAGPDSRTAKAVSCDVVALDELHDLALLKTERPLGEGHVCVLLDAMPPAEGTAVAVTGHSAFAWQPTTQKGRVIRRASLTLFEKSAEKTDVIVLDIPLQRGASGSPVYLDSGVVVGVVERQYPSRTSETVAVPIRYAIELLERLHVRWHESGK
jgi:S1-C subfamily serine protease